jgi:retron-type reverse transcriptase
MIFHNFYDDLISFNNLYWAWRNFRSGKSSKESVLEFEHNLENNLFALKAELENFTYKHRGYQRFIVCDPKRRIIHKAEVRDRVIHTLAARKLEDIYQDCFIAHSFSCQKERGTHRAVSSLMKMCGRLSHNYTENFWYLKCDIKKFFDHIDHKILIGILRRKIKDEKFIWLIGAILKSFSVKEDVPAVGLPLGNFTSQWLGNIYMNELDYFIKQKLRVKYYIRYADDFVLLEKNKTILENLLVEIRNFLESNLKLAPHPDKIILRKLSMGIDWLGYGILLHRVVLRTKTKRRMIVRIEKERVKLMENKIGLYKYYETLNSYLGQLKHCSGFNLSNKIIYNNFTYDYAGKIF